MRRVQLVTLDNGTAETHGADVDPVVKALTVELDGRPRKAVSDALGLNRSQSTHILTGKRPLSPVEIAAIETAWDLPLGTILRRAGLVEDPQSVRDCIRGDHHLKPRDRGALLRFYDSLID